MYEVLSLKIFQRARLMKNLWLKRSRAHVYENSKSHVRKNLMGLSSLLKDKAVFIWLMFLA